MGWTATNEMRAVLAAHVLDLDLSFHKTITPGELIERIDGDVTVLSNFFSRFVLQIVGNALLLVGVMVVLKAEGRVVGNVGIGVGDAEGVLSRNGVTVYKAVTCHFHLSFHDFFPIGSAISGDMNFAIIRTDINQTKCYW